MNPIRALGTIAFPSLSLSLILSILLSPALSFTHTHTHTHMCTHTHTHTHFIAHNCFLNKMFSTLEHMGVGGGAEEDERICLS